MAVDRVPVLKRCRSLGLGPVCLRIDEELSRELKRANKKTSEYGFQLHEKQGAKFVYNVLEKPFRNYYAKTSKTDGMAGQDLVVLLERRLDNVVFHIGFSRIRRETGQAAGRKNILMNGKCVNTPSYPVEADNVIEVKKKSRSSRGFEDAVESTAGEMVPAWLDIDAEDLCGTVKEMPTRGEIDVPINKALIVELCSK